MLEPNLGFKLFNQTALEYTPEYDSKAINKVIPYGISYLDRMLHGILPDDLVLIGAPSGVGKSELVNEIAFKAAHSGHKAVVFALEAHEGEFELRAKFKMYTKLIHQHQGPLALRDYTFLDFKLGLMKKTIEPYREVVEAAIKHTENLTVFYRDKNFGIREFKQRFSGLEGKADLVVIDHLHYFDTQSDNENKEFSEIIKEIRNLNQILGIPVVVVGHLRKTDRRDKPLISGLDEFHGTSNIPKVATTIITLAQGSLLDEAGIDPESVIEHPSHRHTTYFRICKSRADGQVTRYIGIGTFDSQVNSYDERFVLAQLTRDEKKFRKIITAPSWYIKRAQKGQAT